MIRPAVLAAVGAAAVVLPAAPATAQPPANAGFERADANGDGRIDRMEFVRARRAAFDRWDRNHDGELERSDFPRLARNPNMSREMDAFIERADMNRNGSVSREEFAMGGSPLFDRADRNADGAVDRAELAAVRQRLDRAPN